MASLLKVEVFSKDIIKPSSPTPPHLKNVHLSFLDQIAPPIYIPLIFFYQIDDPSHHKERSSLLKKSLSDTLVRFYPLAGRINGNSSIDCNDEGVDFYEANASRTLLEVIENPNLDDIKGLFPFDAIGRDEFRTIVLGVQVNHFSCGGMAIGVCISHKIADGTALVTFVKAWAATARVGFEESESIKFDGSSHFPPMDLSNVNMLASEAAISKEKVITKRFIFDKKMLELLKEQAREGSIKDPTRVEVVSALILKHVIQATQERANSSSHEETDVPQIRTLNSTPSEAMLVAYHAANLRPRATPPISEDSFGNFWGPCHASFSLGDINTNKESSNFPCLVSKLREGIRKMDGNFIKKSLQYDIMSEMGTANDVGIERFSFSSWCRFPMYEVDFGWGKPTWVCTTTMPFKNLAILLSSKCGEGIEAWVNLLEDDTALLQQNFELLSSSTPLMPVVAS